MAALRRRQRKWRPRRDWGEVLAGVLCTVFAVVGAMPLALGLLVRTGPVRAWAAEKTSALLAEKLGVSARYEVAVRAWPMMVSLENVVVDASDGGTPFLTAERVAVRPRPFSLLAGRLDAGDVEIVGPRVRVVVEGGEVRNLRYHLPESKGPKSKEAPVASLSITDARVDASVEGVEVAARALDVDVSAEEEGTFEIALRVGETAVTRVRAFPGRSDEDAVDDDVLCRAEARVRLQEGSVLVRRLSLQGSADFDPDPGTRPSCALGKTDWRAVEVRLGALRVELPRAASPELQQIHVSGRVHAKVPVPAVHRFVDLAHLTGSVTTDVEVHYDGPLRPPRGGPRAFLEAGARVTGHVTAERAGIDGKVFGNQIDLDVAAGAKEAGGDVSTIGATNLVAHWADGTVTIPTITVKPFEEGIPIETGPIGIEGVELTGLLRDLGAHPQAHVAWTLDKGRFEHMRGFLDPPFIEGPLTVQTHGFEIFKARAVDPFRAHMMGVKEGTVRCTFVINERPRSRYKFQGVVVSNATIDTPRSHMHASVTLGTHTTWENPHNVIDIEVHDGSKVDLAELSPLGDIPIAGTLSLRASGRGAFGHPKITGDLKIADFVFADLPVGELEAPRFAFEPLTIDLFETRFRHGESRSRSGQVRLRFAEGATVVADADVDSTEGPGLRAKDLFEVFRFDKDPRFKEIDGTLRGKSRVHYVLGGREDRCGGGTLDLEAKMDLEDVGVLGERFDGGAIDLGVRWDDKLAGTAGMRAEIRSASLRKGEGSILLGATVLPGGFVAGRAVGSGLPIARVDALASQLEALGAAGKHVEGTASVVAQIGGTLSALTMGADVDVSRLRIGPAALGASHLHVGMSASPPPPPRTEKRACHRGQAAGFTQAEWDADASGGQVAVDGSLFDGQTLVDGLRVSRQRRKVIEGGRVTARGLDLGTIANLVPGVAFSDTALSGSLSATLDVERLPLAAPQTGRAKLVLEALHLAGYGLSADLAGKAEPIVLGGDKLDAKSVKVALGLSSGFSATVAIGGAVKDLSTTPSLDVGLYVPDPVDLGRLLAGVPSIDRAAGSLKGSVSLAGPLSAPHWAGQVDVQKGELQLKGFPVGLTEAEVSIAISDGDARVTNAVAKVGGGTLRVTGHMPLRGAERGVVSANVEAHGVKAPIMEGMSLTADAKLDATWRLSLDRQKSVPDVKGTVEVTQLTYTRPLAFAGELGIGKLGRAARRNVDTYDPENDVVHFNVNVVSPRPLHLTPRPPRERTPITISVVDMEVEMTTPSVVLTGTNQRFGARGAFRILPDSKLEYRNYEFLVREGYIRFDDPERVFPRFDVRALTEYRRYTSSAEPAAAAAAAAAPGSSGASGAATSPVMAAANTSAAGVWRIALQARGDLDNPQVSITSDPPLSLEDIGLLLTLGLTRAELDRAPTAALGQSVGLEALSTITGADRAVKTVVPLIDDFRAVTGYSSKTASPVPMVTVGKRITDNVRATVTTGLSEDREVRTNVEWRLNRNLSVQGSYDNQTDVSSSPVGNVGVDLRWRIEFE